MLYPCIFCVALSMDLFCFCVLRVVTVFVNCLMKQFAICLGMFGYFVVECDGVVVCG